MKHSMMLSIVLVSLLLVIGIVDGLAADKPGSPPFGSPDTHLRSTVRQETIMDFAPPIGSFDTPYNGATVRGAIPMTGWALDNTGIVRVQIHCIYEEYYFFVGYATFVEGARPDIQQKYSNYPNNSKAGWGYMLLTNCLPNNGNGTYYFTVEAFDQVWNGTVLGTKKVICDNANAVKPFGTIDKPSKGNGKMDDQEEIVSGAGYLNIGWVLAPPPHEIPKDGSTIKLWIDGVRLNLQPVYNLYNDGIAGLFPWCANSRGAAGYFILNTTNYPDGVHTIQWTASDACGNSEGIGSRYFTIQNNSAVNSQTTNRFKMNAERSASILDIPPDTVTPIDVGKGYRTVEESGDTGELETHYPSIDGWTVINTEELERVELHLGEADTINGWMLVGKKLQPLPIGSHLDRETGVFNWGIGPAFVGLYRLVFLLEDSKGNKIKKNILIDVKPKS